MFTNIKKLKSVFSIFYFMVFIFCDVAGLNVMILLQIFIGWRTCKYLIFGTNIFSCASFDLISSYQKSVIRHIVN